MKKVLKPRGQVMLHNRETVGATVIVKDYLIEKAHILIIKMNYV